MVFRAQDPARGRDVYEDVMFTKIPSLEDQLAQLRFNAAAADLQAESEAKQAEFAARNAVALEAEAFSQRNIKRLALETHDFEHQFSNSKGS